MRTQTWDSRETAGERSTGEQASRSAGKAGEVELRLGIANSAFPTGPGWELTAEHAWEWFEQGFQELRGASMFLRSLGPLDRGEVALLLLDLACYESLCERYLQGAGPQPPPLEQYLAGWKTDPETGQPERCRQHWGYLGRLLREAAAADTLGAEASRRIRNEAKGGLR